MTSGQTGRQRRSSSARLVAVVVAALVAVVATRSGRFGSDPSDDAVAPQAIVLARSGASEPGPPLAPDEVGPTYEQVLGMAVLGRTVVAVGERAWRPRDERPELTEPLAWWSTDKGETWHSASVPGIWGLQAVATVGNRFVAVGNRVTDDRITSAVVLVSTDGKRWAEERVPGLNVALNAAVAIPTGAILAGSRIDATGRVPVALVSGRTGGWRQAVLPDSAPEDQAEIRGACAHGADVMLVGLVHRGGGEAAPLVLRSSDGGTTWRAITLPGPVLDGAAPPARSCAIATDRTAVVGNAVVDGYESAFVSEEAGGTWQDARLLGIKGDGETLATAVHLSTSGLVVVGHDTSDNPDHSDLAVWRSDERGWSRLAGLEAIGSGTGVGVGFAALTLRSLLLVGGSSGDRAVIWRTSLRRAGEVAGTTVPSQGAAATAARKPPVPTGTWWAAHGHTNACDLVDERALRSTLGARPVMANLLSVASGPVIDCLWELPNGTFVGVEIAPQERLDRFVASYPSRLPPPEPITSTCEGAGYYSGTETAIARCGDTTVAVSGLARDPAAALLASIVHPAA